MIEGALHAVFELLVGLPRQDEQVILDPVLHAAVAGGRDTPVEDQVEIAEGLRGNARERLANVGLSVISGDDDRDQWHRARARQRHRSGPASIHR